MNTTNRKFRIVRFQTGLFPSLSCLGILFFSALAVMAQNSATNANLVTNGSFELEKVVGGGKLNPEGWGFYGTTNTLSGVYVVDGGQQVHSETRSVSIVGKEGTSNVSYGMWLSDLIEVVPGRAYSVEGWIKTSECTGQGAWLWVNAYEKKDEGAVGAFTLARPVVFFSGTEDWGESSAQIHISKNVRWLRIACRLDGPGTVWFDDIQVSKVE